MTNTAVPETPKTVAEAVGGDATPAPANNLASNAAPVKGGKKSRRKSRKMNGAAKSWVKFVMEVFNKNLAKNPKYKYKQAMKDASKLRNKNKTAKA
jgi:hypothetical protein